jgi:hypothetical protein
MVFLLVRKETRDIFLLAWFLSLYLIMHRDIIGITTFLHRSLSASAHILIPIIVIGGLCVFSLFKLPENYKFFLKYGAATLIVVFALIFNMPSSYSILNQAYDSPFIRISPAQVEVSEWLKDNIDENANVSIIGPPPEIMQKVWWMASYSHRTSFFFEGFILWEDSPEKVQEDINYHILNDYVVFDYSDIARISDQSIAERWLEFERQNMGNHTMLYNKDNIRVYRHEAA